MLTQDNYMDQAFVFRTRQAGVSLIFDPAHERYVYNAYCLETKLLKELFTQEFHDLEAAIARINDEFGNWELKAVGEDKSGCGSCVAK